jgi:effector-binding domain-containing protein
MTTKVSSVTTEPKIVERSEQPYMGIRLWIPSKELSVWQVKLTKELSKWLEKHNLKPAGPVFHRFYVINMGTEFEFEIGIPVEKSVAGDERVKPGILPAGRYAALIYTGRNNAYKGNKTLVEWARDNGIKWDRWDDPRGDAFRCRYESYLTDRTSEVDKKDWQTEVAIKVVDS